MHFHFIASRFCAQPQFFLIREHYIPLHLLFIYTHSFLPYFSFPYKYYSCIISCARSSSPSPLSLFSLSLVYRDFIHEKLTFHRYTENSISKMLLTSRTPFRRVQQILSSSYHYPRGLKCLPLPNRGSRLSCPFIRRGAGINVILRV